MEKINTAELKDIEKKTSESGVEIYHKREVLIRTALENIDDILTDILKQADIKKYIDLFPASYPYNGSFPCLTIPEAIKIIKQGLDFLEAE